VIEEVRASDIKFIRSDNTVVNIEGKDCTLAEAKAAGKVSHAF